MIRMVVGAAAASERPYVNRMWRNRYDDLWLWPMPEWFVRACNRTVGAYVLDLMLVGVFLGLGLVMAGNILKDAAWMRVVGYVLLAPVPLLIVMMVITAQYRQRKYRNRPPDGGTDAGLSPIEVSSYLTSDGVLVIGYTGPYPLGAAGNSVAEWMFETGKETANRSNAKAVVIDLRRLAYEWGDMIECMYDVGRDCEPPRPQATVVSAINRRALSTLEWGESTNRDITELEEVFDSLDEAVAFVLPQPAA